MQTTQDESKKPAVYKFPFTVDFLNSLKERGLTVDESHSMAVEGNTNSAVFNSNDITSEKYRNSAEYKSFGLSMEYPGPENKNRVFADRNDLNYDKDNLPGLKFDPKKVGLCVGHSTALDKPKDASEEYHKGGVSAHLLVGKDGVVHVLVPLELTAFHAGLSDFGNFRKDYIGSDGTTKRYGGLNPGSIGVEFLTPNYAPLTPEQIESAKIIFSELKNFFPGIQFITHSAIAPSRKVDPHCVLVHQLSQTGATFLPYKASDEMHRTLVDAMKSVISGEVLTNYEDVANILASAGYKGIELEPGKHDTSMTNIFYALYNYCEVNASELILEAPVPKSLVEQKNPYDSIYGEGDKKITIREIYENTSYKRNADTNVGLFDKRVIQALISRSLEETKSKYIIAEQNKAPNLSSISIA